MSGSDPKASDAKVTSTEPLVRPALVERVKGWQMMAYDD